MSGSKKGAPKKHKHTAATTVNVFNSICLVLSVILMVVGGLFQWGQTFLRLTVLPGVMVMVAKGYGKEALSMANIAIVTDSYMTVLSKSGYIIFIVGCVLSNLCSLGLIGVCCKRGFLLLIYIVLTAILTLAVIILIIVFMIKKNQMESSIGENLKETLMNNYKFHNDQTSTRTVDFTGIIDLIQIRGRCCGSYDGKDYAAIARDDYMPFSCCIMNETSTYTPLYSSCPSKPNAENSYYYQGCSNFIWIIIKKVSDFATYTLIGLGIFLGVLVTMAIIVLKCQGRTEYAKPGKAAKT